MTDAQDNTAEEGGSTQVAGAPVGPSSQTIRAVFIGRRSTAAQVEALFPAVPDADPSVSGVPDVAGGRRIVVVPFTNQKSALRWVRSAPPRVLLVELEPRPASRLRFCSAVRDRWPALAILAVGDEPPRDAFGFDGFVSLPLTAEKVARAFECLGEDASGHILQRGPFQLNVATRTLYTPRGSRHMTPKQCALLELLMRRHNEVVYRSDIMAAIWETSYLDDTRTLDVHIRWLRESIEADPSSPLYLLTVRGQGYTFQAPERGPRP